MDKDAIPTLLALLHDDQLPAIERWEIGQQLNQLGDPRTGVSLNADGLPDIDWVHIPYACDHVLEGVVASSTNTTHTHRPGYAISRYLVTRTQYQAFAQAEDYEQEEWWRGLMPGKWPGRLWEEGNYPVCGVNWYEAMAFCRWLSTQLSLPIRLPTEQEWGRAAYGNDKLLFPWGNTYRPGCAHLRESLSVNELPELHGWQQSCAVGLYPYAYSSYGLLDVVGNLWEWCLNKHDDANDINIDLSGDYRAVRGGSWDDAWQEYRAFFREGGHPEGRLPVRGFRLCYAL